MGGRICVIGSINMDLVTVTPRFPLPGETIEGISFNTFPGGKGANQAVASARLGADVTMVGRLGNDVFQAQYREVFDRAGIRTDGVRSEADVSTGLAIIEVDASGENHIIIIPGANGRMTEQAIDLHRDLLASCDIFLLQLEIPLGTVVAAAKLLHSLGKTVILDPAPARQLPDGMYHYIDIITPNQSEARILTGIEVTDEATALRAGADLCSRGVKCVIIKAGAHGAYLVEGASIRRVPGFEVSVVDTTAAGDSFNGGLAFALSAASGQEQMYDAVRFANAVGALSTTAKGAQTAMPDLATVNAFLSR